MPRTSRSRSSAPNDVADDDIAPNDGGASELSYRQAQTALELTLSELQTSDLDVETMASLYQRAQAYADRCDVLLHQVEQEVMQWDAQLPDQPPRPLEP